MLAKKKKKRGKKKPKQNPQKNQKKKKKQQGNELTECNLMKILLNSFQGRPVICIGPRHCIFLSIQ